MKSGISMMLYAIMQAKADGMTLAWDIVLSVVCDEESGGDFGARYLVEEHPEQFQGIDYAIGEFGGFSFELGGRRFYQIMVSEKQVCHLRVTYRGAVGHASLNQEDNPMTGLSRFLQRVQSRQFPTHVTLEADMMFQVIGKHLSPPSRIGLAALLNPRFTSLALKLLGAKGRTFAPLFRNTVNPSVVHGGEQINVVSNEVTLDLDGRLLPNFSTEQFESGLRLITDSDATLEIEVLSHDTGLRQPAMGLFDTLSSVLKESDPDGIPVPMLMPAATDGRLFARLGIQTYGSLPMLLPKTLDFAATIHGTDERAPADTINFGADAIYRLLQHYGHTG